VRKHNVEVEPMSTAWTFGELGWLDPSLRKLEADAARAARAGRRDRGWCPVACYYGRFGRWIWRLVGWYREENTGDVAVEWVLRTSTAYDTVVARIYNELHGETILPEPVARQGSW
jgi:hypothetical protein